MNLPNEKQMKKIRSMVLIIKMDRPIDKSIHYISPGGYELKFRNKQCIAFDFMDSFGVIDEDDRSIIHFKLQMLDTDSFPDSVRLLDNLLGSEVVGIVECYIYTGEEDGNAEINPLSLQEMFFITDDYDIIEISDNILSAFRWS